MAEAKLNPLPYWTESTALDRIKHDSWIDVVHVDQQTGDRIEVGIKFDGNVWFSEYDKEGKQTDYYRIDNIDDEIKMFQELKKAAEAHFGEGWPY